MQNPLWYDTHADAINSAITSSGKTFKQVASALWPTMKMDSAYARLKNCLNPAKDEKLSFAEVIFICRETGQLDPLFYACDELSLARTKDARRRESRADAEHSAAAGAASGSHAAA